jgi:predicted RND superfamily exporter protein
MINFRSSILILISLIITSFYFLTKVNITNTPGTYIPKTLKSKILNDEVLEQFNNDDTLLLLFKSQTPLDKSLIKNLHEFISKTEELELIKEVKSIFNYESIRSINDGFETVNILNGEDTKLIDINSISEQIKADRFVKDFFITNDMKIFGIIIEPFFINDSIIRLELEDRILKTMEKTGLTKYLHAYGGEFAVDTAQYKELNRIMFIVLPITLLISIFLLYFLFNSYFVVFLGATLNGLVAVIVLSLFGLFGWPYNMLASIIPTLMMALCIAFVVHLFNGILLRKENGESHYDSISNTVKSINKASFFSAITTSTGLFSLTISEIPPIRSVGIIGGIGVLIIYFLVMYLLPPILIKFDFGEWKQNKFFKNKLDSIVNLTLHLSINHSKKIIFGFSAGIMLLSLFIYNVKSESNIYTFFNDKHNINVSNNRIKEHFSGTTTVNIVFDSEESSVVSIGFNEKIDSLKKVILSLPEVTRVFSPTDIIKQLNWAFHNERKEFFSVPKSDELMEQYLLIYDGEELYNFLSRDSSRFKMTVSLNIEGANEIEVVLNQIESLIKSEDFSKYKWGLAGYGKMFSDQENLILMDLMKSVAISFAVIFILMAFLWRSFYGSLFCMVPNISPVIAMFIFMGIFGIWLDIGTAMIASVTVGIAVDDTIHIYAGFLKRFEKLGLIEALRSTYNESGRAIIITTIILCSQFLVISIADFKPLRNFGLLTTIGVLTALLFDLILLPALIVIKHRTKSL